MENKFIITDIQRIIYVSKDEYTEKKTRFGNKLGSNELIFHLSGYATVYFNGKTLETVPGSIRFLPKGETSEYVVDRIEEGECIDIFFHTDRPISSEAFTLNITESDYTRSLFKKAFSIWVAKRDGYYFECISLLYKIFAELQKQTYLPEKVFEKLHPALDYIDENFLTEDISCIKLAELCGISYSYLKKLFLKKFGCSPKKHIINMKINYACDLLQSGLYTISQTAEQCGYSDIYFFSRQFKEYAGVSPSEFMNKYRSSK